MNYQEYRTTYKEAIKAYPEITGLYTENEDEKPIFCTCTNYEKRGTKWVEVERTTENINFIFYSNIVDPAAIRFFRNLGGIERITKSYTKRGYLPIEVSSTSPDREHKTVRSFSF